MKVNVITVTPQSSRGLYQVGISVLLEEGRSTTDVPHWMASRISKALGGSGEAELVSPGECTSTLSPFINEGRIWQIELPHKFDGRMEFNFDVLVETPQP